MDKVAKMWLVAGRVCVRILFGNAISDKLCRSEEGTVVNYEMKNTWKFVVTV
jgi:hypothetical protein